MAARRKVKTPVQPSDIAVPEAVAPPAPEMPSGWFIVNARGSIHSVNEDDFHVLIARPGWRAATATDLERLNQHGGSQPFPKE
jgi:hypothetical protein